MHKRMTVLGLLALAAAWTWRPAAVHASTRSGGKSRKPPVDRGPAETRAERDRRLQRECRGKPNAGACEGYGS
jgi:hypothetical protein